MPQSGRIGKASSRDGSAVADRGGRYAAAPNDERADRAISGSVLLARDVQRADLDVGVFNTIRSSPPMALSRPADRARSADM